ncbi:MAG TPA: GNAT family N-acetyltransferase [Saprospiraceae bacterium]|nr:GNAT family N-acetyltransferase [Saprospiraceae bacterium]
MIEVNIRKATIDDMDALFAFEQGVIQSERPYDETLKTGTLHYYDLQSMIDDPSVSMVVAEIENEIIASGYARIQKSQPYLRHSTYAHLGFMFVVEKFRGKGINKMILDVLSKWASEKGITEMRLEVYNDNETAIRAYEKAGFKKHMIEMRMDISNRNEK